MARKEEFPDKESGAAIANNPAATAEKKGAKKWIPLEFNEDGTPNTDKLPNAKTVTKPRVRSLPDGTEFVTQELKYVKAGDPRYSITPAGELIAWYRKRGGVGRKLVYQFKKQYAETKEGKEKKKRDADFRSVLRKNGIPEYAP